MSLPEQGKRDTHGSAPDSGASGTCGAVSGARAPDTSTYLIDADAARGIAVRALSAHGVDDEACALVADALVETSMRGVTTHGLRLLPGYLDDLARRIANPAPRIAVVRESGPSALLDADAALGVVAGTAGAREAVRRAARYGVGAVVVRNSNHFAAASIHSRVMSRAGLVGWAMTSASARVAPFHGRDPLLGTNPVSVAAGAGDHEFVLDMATSQVCLGTVRERGRRGRPLDAGWALDDHGHGTLDPALAAALSPLGPGYKGQGLGMVVALLTAGLADAPLDWELDHIEQAGPGGGRGVAHFLLCLDPAFFGGRGAFDGRLRELVDTTRAAPPADGSAVLCPGDPERRSERAAARSGIALDTDTARALERLARRHGLPAPILRPARGEPPLPRHTP
ncbi:Ldh family oxidoreductase [Streptomyces flavofungini]|uniref:Ldh family oxidoreductase n=1 Tax=Streptomyces flavofungini TaxID=68200 RepID=A0ABS0X7S1_9ACTN|nr:Ldh family oxidoreductase [Streptomyces flavofungini]MBJ3809029.1 Ldh family oxidoreductase [Streptomyces flavofungini]GHC68206.1 lactate dehydrogenase [Streptomyces flavofungini]